MTNACETQDHAARHDGWTRRALLAAAACGVAFAPAPTMADDLAAISLRTPGRKVRFGAAIDKEDLDNPAMAALFRRNCTSITPRNSLKWTATEKQQGVVDFAVADRIVAFARSFDCAVYGHTLIWYRTPGWVQAITDPTALRTAMRNRIVQTMKHFQGSVYAWDVVNEPLEYDRAVLRDSVFQKVIGPDHIRESFLTAHEADPAAVLVLNEAHLEKAGQNYADRRALMLQMLTDLRAKNVPIHGVGLQSHFRPGLDRLDEQGVADFCAALKRIGIDVYVTELDASCRFIKTLPNPRDPDIYARVFADVVRVAGKAGTLRSVTTWGLAEKPVLDGKPTPVGCPADVVLYDEDLQPLPTLGAMDGALKALR